jgi:hypothetical protein
MTSIKTARMTHVSLPTRHASHSPHGLWRTFGGGGAAVAGGAGGAEYAPGGDGPEIGGCTCIMYAGGCMWIG